MTTVDEVLSSDDLGTNQVTESFLSGFLHSLVLGTKVANGIPNGPEGEFSRAKLTSSDFGYHSTFPGFMNKAKNSADGIMEILKELVAHVSPEFDLSFLEEEEDPVDPNVFEQLVDFVDELLEGGNHGDEQPGIMSGRSGQVRSGIRLQTMFAEAKDITKPQVSFGWTVDNSRDRMFIPKPAGKTQGSKAEEDDAALEGGASHPYEAEIRGFTLQNRQLQSLSLDEAEKWAPTKVGDNDDCFFCVEDEQELLSAIQRIKEDLSEEGREKALAVDLEAHSIRSFQGFVCLMQVSTWRHDFLIDTILLRNKVGSAFADLLADDSIVKVFHGAESDIKWLQRDFGLYVVNLFDTFIAGRRLGYSPLSLAYLLDRFCGIKANKKFQLADWRVRPLSIEMKRYAREDTHYLLYIYQRMKCELCEKEGKEGIAAVFDACRDVCLLRYFKEAFNPEGYQYLLAKARQQHSLGYRNTVVFARLYDWRDQIARAQDESTVYVMPDRLMLRIAQNLPSTFEELQACGNPLPPLVLGHSYMILDIINKASAVEPAERLGSTEGTSDQAFSSIASVSYINERSSPSPSQVRTTPVMLTEDLYRMAGWVSPEGEPRDGNTKNGPALTIVAPGNEGMQTSRILDHSLVLSEVTDIKQGGSHSDVENEKLAIIVRREMETDPLISSSQVNLGMALEDIQIEGRVPMKVDEDYEEEEEDDEGEDQMPDSMADIYRISNRNRRRNKEKKKLQDQGTDGGEMEDEGTTWTEGDIKDEEQIPIFGDPMDPAVSSYFTGCKRKKCDVEETLRFMENIGWVTDENRHSLLASSHSGIGRVAEDEFGDDAMNSAGSACEDQSPDRGKVPIGALNSSVGGQRQVAHGSGSGAGGWNARRNMSLMPQPSRGTRPPQAISSQAGPTTTNPPLQPCPAYMPSSTQRGPSYHSLSQRKVSGPIGGPIQMQGKRFDYSGAGPQVIGAIPFNNPSQDFNGRHQKFNPFILGASPPLNAEQMNRPPLPQPIQMIQPPSMAALQQPNIQQSSPHWRSKNDPREKNRGGQVQYSNRRGGHGTR